MDFQQYASHNSRKSTLFTFAAFILLGVLISGISFYFIDYHIAPFVGVGVSALVILLLYINATKVALTLAHAQEISPEANPHLHNLVEEMTLASGIVKPKIYMVEDMALNAFATGNAEVGHLVFTRGILATMDRDQLQGIIGHEIAHLRNGDSKLMTIVASVGLAIGIIADISVRMLIFGGRGNNNNSGPIVIVALVVSILGIILAPIIASLIQASVSREREWLADATAVEFTRNPTGLRRALETLSVSPTRPARSQQSTAHLWIAEPLMAFSDGDGQKKTKTKKESRFSTHPPINERINRLRQMESLAPEE